jgi:hypothetical protein
MSVNGEPNEERELVVALAEMTEEAAAIAIEVRDLKAFGLRNRSLIRWVGASMVLCLAVAVGLIWAVIEVRSTAATAKRAASTTRQVCETANERNVVQRRLWDGILALPPDHVPTPEDNARRAQIVTLLDQAFTQANCEGG